jgi:hypothetical protein
MCSLSFWVLLVLFAGSTVEPVVMLILSLSLSLSLSLLMVNVVYVRILKDYHGFFLEE